MSEHFIKKCKFCGTVISQCRCFQVKKTIKYGVCGNCSDLPGVETPNPGAREVFTEAVKRAGLTEAQVRDAWGLFRLSVERVANCGAGQAPAIIFAENDGEINKAVFDDVQGGGR